MPACGSPGLIAACHALRRFLAPRHPPFALSSLTTENDRLAILENRPIRLSKSIAGRPAKLVLARDGGDERIRTADPLLAKQVLSQLSYIPDIPILVGLPGVEPGTSRLSSARSSQLS